MGYCLMLFAVPHFFEYLIADVDSRIGIDNTGGASIKYELEAIGFCDLFDGFPYLILDRFHHLIAFFV